MTKPAAPRPRYMLAYDVTVLVGAAFVLAASVLLSPAETTVVLFGVELPPLCLFKNFTGWNCLGCGLTRSFVLMGHIDPAAAFDRHLLGPVLYLAVALQVPWRIITIVRGLRRRA